MINIWYNIYIFQRILIECAAINSTCNKQYFSRYKKWRYIFVVSARSLRTYISKISFCKHFSLIFVEAEPRYHKHMFIFTPDRVQILLRPGAALRAALPEQRHEREEVRKRVEGRAVVHRIRSRGGTAVDAGRSAGRWRAGGALCPGSRRCGNSETGAAALCYLLRLSQAVTQSYVKRDVDQ